MKYLFDCNADRLIGARNLSVVLIPRLLSLRPPSLELLIRGLGIPGLLLVAASLAVTTPVEAESAGAGSPPLSMRGCAGCHPNVYSSYLRHGMSRSLGKVQQPPSGKVSHPKTGWQYEMRPQGDTSYLTAIAPDGGIRSQKVVGQIGAGIFDISYATAELHPATGEPVNRLFFAPVETVTDHGLELSPFEMSERPSGVNMALTEGCLTCHTDSSPASLPGASANGRWIDPGHALGVDAFDHLKPLGCEACHGSARKHLRLVSGLEEGDGLGLELLAELSPARQRDVCARCHLQGDVRFQMVKGRPSLDKPLAAQFPTLVTATPGDDFRFVGQLERLSLSKCFEGAPEMTCTTCHDPHTSFRQQGVASFERACVQCHGRSPNGQSPNGRSQTGQSQTGQSRTGQSRAEQVGCSRSPELTVQAVTGSSARGELGCVDCHVRQSEPFDLPGIATTDHYIRRSIPRREKMAFRSVTTPGGDLKLWDDGRLDKLLSTTAGKLWRDGLLAMAYVQIGRFQEAVTLFDRFPNPGSSQAIQPSAPAPLESVETWPTFHQLRGMALLGAQRLPAARAAFGDALRLDPDHPGALMGRARMAMVTGDSVQTMHDTQRMIETYPLSESPWQLRAVIAQRLGRGDFQIKALEEMVRRWPSDARTWLQLATLYRAAGADAQAAQAAEQARRLQPSLMENLGAPAPSSRR